MKRPSAPTDPAVVSDEPGSRGTTSLADRVVEKIAARAASDVEHCVGLPRSIAGLVTGRPAVQADAVTDGAITSLVLRLGVVYPAPIVSTTRAVRATVTETVNRLCGLRVDHVDITVASLTRQQDGRGRVQ